MNQRIIRFLIGTTIALAIALLLLVVPSNQVTYAIGSGTDVGVGTTADEYGGTGCSLREAIHSQNIGSNFGGCFRVFNLTPFDNIFLPSGTYTLTQTGAGEDLDVTGDLDIRNSMIISATGATPPIVRGDLDNEVWGDRIIHVVTGTVTIKRIVIREGNELSGVGGGAVRIESGQSLTLVDSEVRASNSYLGGGIYNAGALTLNNVTVSGNLNTSCTLSCSGGGIESLSGSTMLTNVTLNGNSAATYGGGINVNYSTMTLTNVTLNGNSAGTYGGGIFNDSGTLTLINLTLSANSSATSGGGIFNAGTGTATLTNVTLSANSAITNSGGIHTGALAVTTLTNTIVANSPSGGNCNPSLGGSLNLSSDNTCGFGAGRDNINVMLAPLGNYGGSTLTHMLLPGSPAIDFGTDAGCPSTDQRGAHRPICTHCDVGAYEAGYLFLPLILK